MGARQSRRSVDITTTPKKESIPKEGGSDSAAEVSNAAEKIEKLGSIEEAAAADSPAKPTSNGTAAHTEASPEPAEDKDKDKDEATEKDKAKEKSDESKEEAKPEENKEEGPSSPSEVTTPTDAPATPATPGAADTPNTKEAKKKEKSKKKWSLRSISFSRKDKSKPVRDAAKNGDVAKEEPLTEGKEEAEAGTADKSAVSSPTSEESKEAPTPSKEEEVKKPEEAAKPAEEAKVEEPVAAKKEEPSVAAAPAPVPAPAEDKKVEVSPGAEVDTKSPESSASTTTSTTITERKTTEDIDLPKAPQSSSNLIATSSSTAPPQQPQQPQQPQLPHSPPPTPIDPSPLQQALQSNQTPTASALADALNVVNEVVVAAAPSNDLVLNTEEGPMPVCAFKVAPPSTEEKEVVKEEPPSPPSPVKVEAKEEEEVPPPLPECPAPVLETSSKIASFAATTMLEEAVAAVAPVAPAAPALDNDKSTTQQPDSLDMLPPPSPQQFEEVLADDVEDISEDLPLPPPSNLEDAAQEEEEEDEEVAPPPVAAVPTLLQNGHHKDNESDNLKPEVADKTEVAPTFNGFSDDVPKNAPPAVPQETVQSAPAITEDVASVTKAIEEIEISDKAVAAGMNIENVGANEIVADSVHKE